MDATGGELSMEAMRSLLAEREQDARVAAEIGKALVEKNAQLQDALDFASTYVSHGPEEPSHCATL